jgi:lipopolysaccharide transport system permease protein
MAGVGELSVPLAPTSIRPARGWVPLNLRELWEYREILYFLVWRDVKVRYKQTVLGVAWAVIQPVFMMVVFSLFFGQLAKIATHGLPYPLFVYCGLLPWQLFAHGLGEASNSLVANERLLTKVFFPRLVVPLASVVSALIDFLIAFGVLVGLMVYYGAAWPGARIVALPLFMALGLATAFGAGLWLSALNVQYRDVRYTLTFLIQLWFFATPVAYASTVVPAAWRPLYGLNPMTAVVEGFRWALLPGVPAPGPGLWISVGMVAALVVGGLYYFAKMEQWFADLV